MCRVSDLKCTYPGMPAKLNMMQSLAGRGGHGSPACRAARQVSPVAQPQTSRFHTGCGPAAAVTTLKPASKAYPEPQGSFPKGKCEQPAGQDHAAQQLASSQVVCTSIAFSSIAIIQTPCSTNAPTEASLHQQRAPTPVSSKHVLAISTDGSSISAVSTVEYIRRVLNRRVGGLKGLAAGGGTERPARGPLLLL